VIAVLKWHSLKWRKSDPIMNIPISKTSIQFGSW
jgi:hypothetical protein